MKQEEFDALVAKFEEANGAKITEQVKEALKDMPDFDAVKQLIEKDYAEASAIAELKEILEAQGEDIAKITHKGEQKSQTLEDQIKENKDAILGLANKSKNTPVVVKANVTRASVASNPQATELSDIGQLAHRQLSMYDAFPKIPVSESNNNGVIRYYDWDDATKVRAAAMVAEGAAFPESTAAWTVHTVSLKKVGDTLPVTEEFFEDEAMFAAELNQFLQTNVNLQIDNQICNGDGTGENLTGLFQSIDAYTPVASGITDASIYDLVPKVCESITITGGSKYTPNVAFMNKADINKMKLKKDDNNNYVMPPFVSRDGSVVDGVTVIESNIVAANSMVIGDRRFARIYEKTGLELSQGYVNAQFTSDQMTLKARKRLLFLIRNADKGGWRKVTSISAALTTLATP